MCRGKRNRPFAVPNCGNVQNPLIHGQYSPSNSVTQRRNHFGESKTPRNNGSALALRINAGQLFSGREPWFRLQARKLTGRTDEVIQQGKVPEGVTIILLQKGQESIHSEKGRLEE
jgi:hypothetical protein